MPAAGGTAEDDGCLLAVVSGLVGPPRRVTAGIHGSWTADSALPGENGKG
ncbi:hypothetical protein [Streptomyces sp. NPDC047841]